VYTNQPPTSDNKVGVSTLFKQSHLPKKLGEHVGMDLKTHSPKIIILLGYPPVNIQTPIEHGHRNG